MNPSNFLRIPKRIIKSSAAALLITGAMFAASSAAAAPAGAGQRVQDDSAVTQTAQFKPTPICNAHTLPHYLLSTSTTYNKNGTKNDWQGVVVCEITPKDRDAISSTLGYNAHLPLYYIAGSHSTNLNGPLGQKDAIAFLQNSFLQGKSALPAGIYIAPDGTPTPIGVNAPAVNYLSVEQVGEILAKMNQGQSQNAQIKQAVVDSKASAEGVLESPPIVAASALEAADISTPTQLAPLASVAPATVDTPVVVAPPLPDWVSHKHNGVTYASLRKGTHGHRINNIEIHKDNSVAAQVTAIYKHQRMTASIKVDHNDVSVSNLVGGDRQLFAEWLQRGGVNEVHQARSDILSHDVHGPAVTKVSRNQVSVTYTDPVEPVVHVTPSVGTTYQINLKPSTLNPWTSMWSIPFNFDQGAYRQPAVTPTVPDLDNIFGLKKPGLFPETILTNVGTGLSGNQTFISASPFNNRRPEPQPQPFDDRFAIIPEEVEEPKDPHEYTKSGRQKRRAAAAESRRAAKRQRKLISQQKMPEIGFVAKAIDRATSFIKRVRTVFSGSKDSGVDYVQSLAGSVSNWARGVVNTTSQEAKNWYADRKSHAAISWGITAAQMNNFYQATADTISTQITRAQNAFSDFAQAASTEKKSFLRKEPSSKSGASTDAGASHLTSRDEPVVEDQVATATNELRSRVFYMPDGRNEKPGSQANPNAITDEDDLATVHRKLGLPPAVIYLGDDSLKISPKECVVANSDEVVPANVISIGSARSTQRPSYIHATDFSEGLVSQRTEVAVHGNRTSLVVTEPAPTDLEKAFSIIDSGMGQVVQDRLAQYGTAAFHRGLAGASTTDFSWHQLSHNPAPKSDTVDSNPTLIEQFKAAKQLVKDYRKNAATEADPADGLTKLATLLPNSFENDAATAFKAARYVFNMRAKELGTSDYQLLKLIDDNFATIKNIDDVLGSQSANFVIRNAKGVKGQELRNNARSNLQRPASLARLSA